MRSLRSALPRCPPPAAALLAGLAAALAAGGPAGAQPSLPAPPAAPGAPSTGTVQGGFSGDKASADSSFYGASPVLPFGSYPFGIVQGDATQAPPGAARGWRFDSSIGLDLIATDNVDNTARGRRSDLITTISPTIAVQADTARVTGRLFYTPMLRLYARDSGPDRIDHRFSGQMLATVVDDLLYFDLRAIGGLQSASGGYGSQSGGLQTNSRDQVQTLGFQASPYLLHRFGGLGTAQVGYSYQYSTTDGQSAAVPGSAQPFFAQEETTAHQGYAILRSGDDFGRLLLEQRTVGTVYESDGVLSGAHRFTSALQVGYAVTRAVTLFVEGGYENQHYGGTAPFDIEGPIWSVGTRLTPGPDSTIALRYGRRDGYDAFGLDAAVSLGGRTRLFATYSDRVASPTQQGLDLLSSSSVDAAGNLVNGTTGAPTAAPFGGGLLATQSTVFRTKRAAVTAVQSWERDSIALNLSYEDRVPLTSAVGTTGFEQKGYTVGLSWSRRLTPELIGFAGVDYGVTRSPRVGDGTYYTARLGLSQQLGPSLFGSVQYVFRKQSSDLVFGDSVQNAVILSLRQLL